MLIAEKPRKNALNRLLMVAGALGLVAAVTVIAMSFMTEGKSRKRNIVQQIAILRPPPPPKPEEKPPEPEVEEEEVKLPEPDLPPEPQQAEAPPAGPELGVDAEGTGNGDSFGLVGKPGGKDITTIGDGGGGGDRHRWYAGLIQSEVQKLLARNSKLRGAEYRVVVKVWLALDGSVERAELGASSGKPDTDALIRQALAEMPPLRDKPPTAMPQPLRLRLTSRS